MDELYRKEEICDPETIGKLREHYAAILGLLGEDPQREGLLKTPERVAKAMLFLTKGYAEDPLQIIRSAMFREEYKQMVLVKDIELYSLCEHHMLPFYGKAHVAYIPNGRITGLSKIARVVECFARRLQVQERLTVQIRDCIQEALDPMGVAVVIEASHMCMRMRGVEKQESATTTSAFTGVFLALWMTSTPLSLIALIGAIMLVGIVTKNGIVMVDYMNLLIERGSGVFDAVIAGGKSRLRPVLMTSFTTVLGMLPLAIGTGAGSETWQPMGIAVIGGLTCSTLLTLFIVPVLYSILVNRAQRKEREKAARLAVQHQSSNH